VISAALRSPESGRSRLILSSSSRVDRFPFVAWECSSVSSSNSKSKMALSMVSESFACRSFSVLRFAKRVMASERRLPAGGGKAVAEGIGMDALVLKAGALCGALTGSPHGCRFPNFTW